MKTREHRLRTILHRPLSISVNWLQISRLTKSERRCRSCVPDKVTWVHGPEPVAGCRANPSQWYRAGASEIDRDMASAVTGGMYSLIQKNHPGERLTGGTVDCDRVLPGYFVPTGPQRPRSLEMTRNSFRFFELIALTSLPVGELGPAGGTVT